MKLPPDPHARPFGDLVRAYGLGAFSVAPQILANQWLPRATLRRLALKRVRQRVAHAQRNVPFYAKHLAGVDPRGLRTEDDVAALPFLTKPQARAAGDTMLARGVSREGLLERESGGSSGSPLRVFFDPLTELPRRVQELRFLTAHGFRPWHTQLIFDNPGHGTPGRFALQRLGLWRREMFPSWLAPEDALRRMSEQQPDVIHGVLSSLRLLALVARSTGGLGYRPRLLVSKGEHLDVSTRALIESGLGAPLVDCYATEETGIIAWQCPSGAGHHVDEDLVYLEVVRHDGTRCAPGELGELVLTNLYMKAMPFIRYRVADLGALSADACGCGRGLPLLVGLRGRGTDLVHDASGKPRHAMALMTVMESVSGLRSYRIVQTSLERIELQVRWMPDLSSESRTKAEAQLRSRIQDLMGNASEIVLVEGATASEQLGVKQPVVLGLKPAGG